jgi:site-specific DNA-methyltransferase (adenine-specific)
VKPYYQDDLVTLYHGDCREILPTIEPVGAVVTDPPYGLGDRWAGGGGSVRSSWRFSPKEAQSWDGSVVDGVESLVALAPEVVIWGGNYYRLPPSRCWLIWDKKQPDTWTTGQAELAWTNLDRPVRVFRFAQCELATEGPKVHPTQKPLNLMLWCLKWVKAPLIVDPFAGSGTTLVAAKQMGRRAIGIEIDEKYCSLAAERLSQNVLDLGGVA